MIKCPALNRKRISNSWWTRRTKCTRIRFWRTTKLSGTLFWTNPSWRTKTKFIWFIRLFWPSVSFLSSYSQLCSSSSFRTAVRWAKLTMKSSITQGNNIAKTVFGRFILAILIVLFQVFYNIIYFIIFLFEFLGPGELICRGLSMICLICRISIWELISIKLINFSIKIT
jgi:hypothetical protein